MNQIRKSLEAYKFISKQSFQNPQHLVDKYDLLQCKYGSDEDEICFDEILKKQFRDSQSKPLDLGLRHTTKAGTKIAK